jgi:hypothetical protein
MDKKLIGWKKLEASSTVASTIMMPSPIWVSVTDSAMDTLTLVTENHFCHLPILDKDGSISGLLGIVVGMHGCVGVDSFWIKE